MPPFGQGITLKYLGNNKIWGRVDTPVDNPNARQPFFRNINLHSCMAESAYVSKEGMVQRDQISF